MLRFALLQIHVLALLLVPLVTGLGLRTYISKPYMGQENLNFKLIHSPALPWNLF